MGRDKAAVKYHGEPLWRHQIATLEAVGPAEILISGKQDGPYVGASYPVIRDETPGLGPLSGLASGLQHSRNPLVLVLAIDLPAMEPDFLRALVRQAIDSGKGAVPFDGLRFHPLAAAYPQACLPLALAGLRSEDRSLQRFVRASAESGLIAPREIFPEELGCFENINTQADLKRLEAANPAPCAG